MSWLCPGLAYLFGALATLAITNQLALKAILAKEATAWRAALGLLYGLAVAAWPVTLALYAALVTFVLIRDRYAPPPAPPGASPGE